MRLVKIGAALGAFLAIVAGIGGLAFAEPPGGGLVANVERSSESDILSNDQALDFFDELDRSDANAALSAAFDLPKDEYLQQDAGAYALVAATIVAAARDGRTEALPEAVARFVLMVEKPVSPSTVEAARKAAERVLMDSETKDLH